MHNTHESEGILVTKLLLLAREDNPRTYAGFLKFDNMNNKRLSNEFFHYTWDHFASESRIINWNERLTRLD